MQKRLRVYITGEPGVGKTTLLSRLVELLKKNGLKVNGFYCPEVRENGIRIGFKIKSFDSEIEDWLATTREKSNIKIGKYYVVLKESIVEKLRQKIEEAEIVAIDEIGPMELSVPRLRDLINFTLREKPYLIAVVHRKLSFSDGKIFVVSKENRDKLSSEIYNYVINFLKIPSE